MVLRQGTVCRQVRTAFLGLEMERSRLGARLWWLRDNVSINDAPYLALLSRSQFLITRDNIEIRHFPRFIDFPYLNFQLTIINNFESR